MPKWTDAVSQPQQNPLSSEGVEVLRASSATIPHHSSEETLSKKIDKVFRGLSLGGAAIALSPFALEKAGIGKKEFEFLGQNGSCCQLISAHGPSWATTKDGEQTYGIAGALSAALGRLPVVGDDLSRGGMANALAAGGIMIVGHYSGKALEKRAAKQGKESTLGKVLCTGSKLVGFAVALPAILPGMGHGTEFLSAVAKVDDLDMEHATSNGPGVKLMGILGKNPGVCKGNNKLSDGAMGAASIPVAQLCCALPALVAAVPAIFNKTRSGQEQGR